MSKHEIAILTRIYQGPVPMTFTDRSDVDAVRILHGIGLVNAKFERPAGARGDHGQVMTAVVVGFQEP